MDVTACSKLTALNPFGRKDQPMALSSGRTTMQPMAVAGMRP